MQVLFRLENPFSKFQVRICTQKRINDHVLNGDAYTNFDEIMVIANLKSKERTRFMFISHLMEFTPGLTYLVDVIRVFDVVTDLVVKDACGIDDANL
jgi:hypothetical protein